MASLVCLLYVWVGVLCAIHVFWPPRTTHSQSKDSITTGELLLFLWWCVVVIVVVVVGDALGRQLFRVP